MRQKLKLSFAQLEQEMELEGNILSSPEDLSSVAGAAGIEDYVAYFTGLGFNLVPGANGNYYTDGYMWLDPVIVTGLVDNDDSIYSSYSYEQEAYSFSSPYWDDDTITIGVGSSYTYPGGSSSNPGSGSGSGSGSGGAIFDPWLRDGNGDIQAYPTDYYTTGVSISNNLTADMRMVTLYAKSGQVLAYEVLAVYDSQNNPVTLEAQYMSNCFGLAFGDGNYWFKDDFNRPGDEFEGMDNLINTLYTSECTKQEATMVVIYDDDNVAIHCAQYDPTTDQYYGKGGSKEAMVWIGEESFRRGYETSTDPQVEGDYERGRIEYLKPR